MESVMRGRSRNYRVTVTDGQKERLAQIKKWFGENGYKIFPVSLPMRRSERDFVVVHAKTPVSFFLIRPAKNELIEIRTFTALPYVVRHIARELCKPSKRSGKLGPLRVGRALPIGKKQRGWGQYVEPQPNEEFSLWFQPELVAPTA